MKIFLWIIFPYICLTSFVAGPRVALQVRQVRLDQPVVGALREEDPLVGIAALSLRHPRRVRRATSWVCSCPRAGPTPWAFPSIRTTWWRSSWARSPESPRWRVWRCSIYRRRTTPSVLRVTTVTDKVMYPLLGASSRLGLVNTIGVNLFGVGGYSGGYNYRDSVAVWFRDVLTFHPSAAPIAGAPWSFELARAVRHAAASARGPTRAWSTCWPRPSATPTARTSSTGVERRREPRARPVGAGSARTRAPASRWDVVEERRGSPINN